MEEPQKISTDLADKNDKMSISHSVDLPLRISSTSSTTSEGNTQPVDNTTDVDTIQTSVLEAKGLRFAPPEIREKIFAFVFEEDRLDFLKRNDYVPAFLDTLWERKPDKGSGWLTRGDFGLYQEAKRTFYKMATFYVNMSWVTYKKVSVPIDSIRLLEIDISESINSQLSRGAEMPIPKFSIGQPSGPVESLCEMLCNAKNIRVLTIYFIELRRPLLDLRSLIYGKAIHCIQSFPNLRKVSIEIRYDELRPCTHRPRLQGPSNLCRDIEEGMKAIGNGFGFEDGGKVEFAQSCIASCGSWSRGRITGEGSWEAKPGESLSLAL